MTAIDAYTNRVYRIIVLIIPAFCLCASATICALNALGYYPGLTKGALGLFVASDLIYLAVGIHLYRTGFTPEGTLRRERLVAGKYAMAAIVTIQWNAISYLWPFRDFWAYCVLFVIVEAFFFDERLCATTTALICVSMFVSWAVGSKLLLPARDGYFVANMVFRLVGITLMLGCVNLICYFGGHFLVEELERYVNYDTLTHLLTRRSMDERLAAAWRRARAGRATFCLLMLDIDDFKRINDTYGHECGDQVLKAVAGMVLHAVGEHDRVFRWGGEEILVIVSGDEGRAMRIAEAIRADVESHAFAFGSEEVFVTVTIGVAPYRSSSTVTQMTEEADRRLYLGKRQGKNQVVGSLADEGKVHS